MDTAYNLKGQELTNEDELKIVYEGPSFQGRIEISDLSEQLKAVNKLIRDISDELASKKIIAHDSSNIEIYVVVKKGSFEQHISLFFSNAELRGYIFTVFFFVIQYFLSQRSEDRIIKEINSRRDLEIIKDLIKMQSAQGIKAIHAPLRTEGDHAKFLYQNEEKVRILFEDKKSIDKKIQEEEDKIEMEELEQELVGYLSYVDIDSNKFKFHIEDTNDHIPTNLDSSLDEIKELLGERVKIRAKVFVKSGKKVRMEVISYKKHNKRSLSDYYGNDDKKEN